MYELFFKSILFLITDVKKTPLQTTVAYCTGKKSDFSVRKDAELHAGITVNFWILNNDLFPRLHASFFFKCL